mgnify:CR=1 FL=1
MDLITSTQPRTMTSREIAAEQAAQGVTAEVARFLFDDIEHSTCECTERAIKASARLAIAAAITDECEETEQLVLEAIVNGLRAVEFANDGCSCGSGWIAAAALKSCCASAVFTKLTGYVSDQEKKAYQKGYDYGTELLHAFCRRPDSVQRRQNRSTYIVFSPASRLIKIGRAINPPRRIAAIGTQSGCRLEVIKLIDRDIEAQLHKQFKEIRVYGEWFKDDGQIRAYCASLTVAEA